MLLKRIKLNELVNKDKNNNDIRDIRRALDDSVYKMQTEIVNNNINCKETKSVVVEPIQAEGIKYAIETINSFFGTEYETDEYRLKEQICKPIIKG